MTDYAATALERIRDSNRKSAERRRKGEKLAKSIVTKHAVITEGDTFGPVRVVKIDGNKIAFTFVADGLGLTMFAVDFVELYKQHIPPRTRGAKEDSK